MSGHSKWHQIKRQKGAADVKRGQEFTKVSRIITLAVKEGGGSVDPNNNFKLRLAIEKARALNMPKDNIKRAIDRATGKEASSVLEQVVYEGYAPYGVAIIIEAVTDNKQRTAATLKHLLDMSDGHLADPGSVAYLFERQGFIAAEKNNLSEDEALEKALNAGATDFENADNLYEIYTAANSLHEVKEKMAASGFTIQSSELTFRPKSTIPLEEKEKAERIIKLMDALDELDDVQKVYANFDIPADFIK